VGSTVVWHYHIEDYHIFRGISGYGKLHGNLDGNFPANCGYQVILVNVNQEGSRLPSNWQTVIY
jgi:hypothetical protein